MDRLLPRSPPHPPSFLSSLFPFSHLFVSFIFSFVRLAFLPRVFFSYAPSSVGGLDGWSLFVFRYAKLRPGISRGLGKLRLPSTTDRKQDSRLKKTYLFFARIVTASSRHTETEWRGGSSD